jgi:hypothetical protein
VNGEVFTQFSDNKMNSQKEQKQSLESVNEASFDGEYFYNEGTSLEILFSMNLEMPMPRPISKLAEDFLLSKPSSILPKLKEY